MLTINNNKLSPIRRFPNFKKNWEIIKLKELTKINQGLQIPISERYTTQVQGSWFYITNEFLKKNAKKQFFIKNPKASVLCNEDDILMTRTGNTGQVVTNVKGVFHNNFFKINFKRNKLYKWFLYHLLTSHKLQRTILKLAGASTIPDLNHTDFYGIKIIIPSIPEQQKIGDFLSSVDQYINNTEQQLSLWQSYKKGMMQQIFSQQQRFKQINGQPYPNWEEKRLQDIAILTSSKRVYQSDYVKVGIPFYRGKEISLLKKQIVPVKTLFIKKELYLNFRQKYGVPQINDILITAVGTIGNVYRVNHNKPFYFKDGNLIWLRHIKENATFVAQLLSFYQQKMLLVSIGSTQKALTIVVLNKLKFSFPSLPEQQKIGDFLSSIDAKISNIQRRLTHVKSFKKSLLQQLFI